MGRTRVGVCVGVCMCVYACGSVNSLHHKTRCSSGRKNQSTEQMTAAKYLLVLSHLCHHHHTQSGCNLCNGVIVRLYHFQRFMYKQELCVNSLDLGSYHCRLLKQHYSPMLVGAFATPYFKIIFTQTWVCELHVVLALSYFL